MMKAVALALLGCLATASAAENGGRQLLQGYTRSAMSPLMGRKMLQAYPGVRLAESPLPMAPGMMPGMMMMDNSGVMAPMPGMDMGRRHLLQGYTRSAMAPLASGRKLLQGFTRSAMSPLPMRKLLQSYTRSAMSPLPMRKLLQSYTRSAMSPLPMRKLLQYTRSAMSPLPGRHLLQGYTRAAAAPIMAPMMG